MIACQNTNARAVAYKLSYPPALPSQFLAPHLPYIRQWHLSLNPSAALRLLKHFIKTLTLYLPRSRPTRDNGYAFFTRNKKPRRVVYACDRAGKYDAKGKDPDVHPTKRRKNTGSKKCDCQMKVATTQQADGWMLKVMEATHNHSPFATPIAHGLYYSRHVR